jgi:rubredoxin
MPKFTEAEANRIAARFNQVAPNARCPLCGHQKFGVVPGVSPLPVQDLYPDPFGVAEKGGHLPCAPMVCQTCGFTFLIHLRTLGGLEDLIEYNRKAW